MKANACRAKLDVAAWGVLIPLFLLAGCASSPVYEDSMPRVRASGKTIMGEVIEYKIRRGDTLYAVARRFGVEWQDLLVANPGLKTRDLRVGQTMLIPMASLVEQEKKKPQPGQEPARKTEKTVGEKEPPSRKRVGHKGPIRAEKGFVWPARGRILAAYGTPAPWREGEVNRGIDIAGEAGKAVLAAKSGRVNVFEKLPGYGCAVLLEHTDGTATLYGYLAEVLIPHWRWVKQGEALGTMGSSEFSKGIELHFRVMRGEQFINPLSVLP